MVDIVTEALSARNFDLACEVYEDIIRDKGPSCGLLLELGSALALAGRITESVTAYLKAYRISTVEPHQLKHFVSALVSMTKERMETQTDEGHTLILNTKDLLDTEPFFCGLCLGTVSTPVTIACGHTFCQKCLMKTDQNTCVGCGTNPSNSSEFAPNVLLAEVVKKIYPHLESVQCKKNFANKLFCEGNYRQACEEYSKALEQARTDHTIWSNRSHAYMALGLYQEAYDDALSAIELCPQWAKGYYRKGVAEEALGKTQEAVVSYMECLALDEGAKAADHNLTMILHELLKPSSVPEDPKHLPSTEMEPMSSIMSANDGSVTDSLTGVKDLLDRKYKNCDKVFKFSSQLDSLNKDLLDMEMFNCSLCYRFLHNPVTTPCGHVFCKHCLDRSLDHSVNCPQCRGSLAEFLAQRRQAITTSIQQMLVKWFPDKVALRQKAHDEEQATFEAAEKIAVIPIFVCTVAFPTMSCPLHIFEPHYRLMIRQAMETGIRQFGMCLGTEEPHSFADYGTMLEIRDVKYFPDGRSVVDTVGGRRFKVLSKDVKEGYHVAKVEFLDENKLDGDNVSELQALHDAIYSKAARWISSLPQTIANKIRNQYGTLPERGDVQAARLGPSWVWWVSTILPVDPRAQLAILSMNTLKERLQAIDRVITYLLSRKQ